MSPHAKLRPLRDQVRAKKHLACPTKPTCAVQKDLSRIAHQIANQLTVINLSCFKLRCAADNVLPVLFLENIEIVQRAVIEITSLVQTLQLEGNPAQTRCCLLDSPQDR
jgi:hypothetical protein